MCTLNRRHFQALAAICPISRANEWADTLATMNPRFNKDRFLQAVENPNLACLEKLTDKDKLLLDRVLRERL